MDKEIPSDKDLSDETDSSEDESQSIFDDDILLNDEIGSDRRIKVLEVGELKALFESLSPSLAGKSSGSDSLVLF
jgi:hypothetical protein